MKWFFVALLVACGPAEKPRAPQPEPEPRTCPLPPPAPTASASTSSAATPSVEAARGQTVPIKLVEGRRTSGERWIVPDDFTKQRMLESADPGVKAEVQLCLDDSGKPASIKLISSSCLPSYDARILQTMAEWRYRPFEIDGRPTAICTTVTYIYRQTNFRARHGTTGRF